MQAQATITVQELCALVGDAAFTIDVLLAKCTGLDAYGNRANYSHYEETVLPKLYDLHGQLTHLCNELSTRDDQGDSVLVPHRI